MLVCLYVYSMIFGVVNVLIGIFCEKAKEAVSGDRVLRVEREKGDSKKFIEEMTHIFKEMTKGNEEVRWPEFVDYIDGDETGHFLRSHGIMTQNARQLFDILDNIDNDPNEAIDLPSFVVGMQRL